MSKMPTGIKPMLATLVSTPFDNELWTYEIKWYGYRSFPIKVCSMNVRLFLI